MYNAQGEGFNAAVTDLAIPPGMSAELHFLSCYVMLSRVYSLDGLLILRLATRAQLSGGAPQYVLDAIDRLLHLERQTQKLMATHLNQFAGVLPPEVLGLFSDTAVAQEAVDFQAAVQASTMEGNVRDVESASLCQSAVAPQGPFKRHFA